MWRGRTSVPVFFSFRIRCDRHPPESSRAGFGACARCSCHGGRSDRHQKRARRKAPGCRTSRFTGCRLRHQIPSMCPGNPRSALPPIALARRSMAAASSGREDWRKCHEVDLRRLRQREPRRGRIRGEGRLGDIGVRRPLLRPEGRCGRRDVRGHCEGLSSPQGLRGPHGRQLVLRRRGRA